MGQWEVCHWDWLTAHQLKRVSIGGVEVQDTLFQAITPRSPLAGPQASTAVGFNLWSCPHSSFLHPSPTGRITSMCYTGDGNVRSQQILQWLVVGIGGSCRGRHFSTASSSGVLNKGRTSTCWSNSKFIRGMEHLSFGKGWKNWDCSTKKRESFRMR